MSVALLGEGADRCSQRVDGVASVLALSHNAEGCTGARAQGENAEDALRIRLTIVGDDTDSRLVFHCSADEYRRRARMERHAVGERYLCLRACEHRARPRPPGQLRR